MQKLLLAAAAILAGLCAPAGAQAQQAKYGALAVDRSNGFHYGFAYDYPTREEAERRALEEGRRKGGDVSVVLVWSGSGCGAYRTVQPGKGDAYGWGVARTRAEAETIAQREADKRAGGQPTPNHVWGCNSNTPAPLNILRNEPVGEPAGGADMVLQNVRIVSQVGFAPDGKTVLTMSYGDNKGMLWDVRTGALLRTFEGLNSAGYGATFSPDGSRLAMSDSDKIIIWNPRTGARLSEHSYKALQNDLAYSADGSVLYAVGAQEDYGPNGGWMLWVFDGATGAMVRKTTLVGPRTHAYYDADYSPDGRLVATAGDKPGEQLKLWDLQSGQVVRKLTSFDPTRSVAFSPDGRRLAVTGTDGVQILDVSGAVIRSFDSGIIYETAFSPDGRRLATANRDKSVGVWDVATGRQLHRMTGHTGIVTNVAFSPDGRLVASGGEDGTARLWNAETGQPLKAVPAKGGRAASSPAPADRPSRDDPRKAAAEAKAEAARAEADRRAAERMAQEAEAAAATDRLNREVAARDAAIKARNEAEARADAERKAAFAAAMAKYERDKARNDAEVAAAKAAREKYEADRKAYEEQMRALGKTP